MAIQTISVTLRGHFLDGRSVPRELFLVRLRVEDSLPAVADRGAWQSALVTFSEREIDDYRGAEDPQAQLEAAVQQDLKLATEWLISRRAELLALQREGLRLDVFVDALIDQDQFDCSFSAGFLVACGQAELPIHLVTND